MSHIVIHILTFFMLLKCSLYKCFGYFFLNQSHAETSKSCNSFIWLSKQTSLLDLAIFQNTLLYYKPFHLLLRLAYTCLAYSLCLASRNNFSTLSIGSYYGQFSHMKQKENANKKKWNRKKTKNALYLLLVWYKRSKYSHFQCPNHVRASHKMTSKYQRFHF